ncbi:MAG: FAD-dependent oxidoreductase [Myxococcales bacterium]|nr:FAD-dependent oxidoreductase [Myxococcales bacterium]
MGKKVLIVGAGPAGLEAARGLLDLGQSVLLVEKQATLGGKPIHSDYAALTPDMRPASVAMQEMIDGVTAHGDAVDIRTETQVVACQGDAPDLTVTLRGPAGEATEEVAAAILCTGFDHFDPGSETQMYGYYEYADVITLADAERMLKAGQVVRPSNGEPPRQLCFIQCVGSRDRQIGNQWCSKVCCGIACKQSIEFRQALGDARVFIFYIDLRAYGFWEDELYWRAQEQHNVNFVRGIVTEVTKRGDQLLVKGEDTTMGRPMEVLMDMVILSVGMEPSAGTIEMSKVFELPRESHGFIETIGGPLNTVVTSRKGIFVAGAATGPADLEDTVSSASAAALKAATFIRMAGGR